MKTRIEKRTDIADAHRRVAQLYSSEYSKSKNRDERDRIAELMRYHNAEAERAFLAAHVCGDEVKVIR